MSSWDSDDVDRDRDRRRAARRKVEAREEKVPVPGKRTLTESLRSGPNAGGASDAGQRPAQGQPHSDRNGASASGDARSERFVELIAGTGGAAAAAAASPQGGDPAQPQLPAWAESQLSLILRMQVAENDGEAAKRRVDMVLATVRALHRPMRRALLVRFEAPSATDELAKTFLHQLSTASRERVLEALRDDTPARTETPEPQKAASLASGAVASDPWMHMFQERSTEVNKLGRVQASKGVFLREKPVPTAAPTGAVVPFDGQVMVSRRTNQSSANQRWCYVVAADKGIAGFCEERYLAMDPPEPSAKLRLTQPGERLAVIAEEAYGKADGLNTSRLYVQALYYANKDRAGVRLDEVELGLKQTSLRGQAEEETLKIYQGAKVIAGTSIWIPSKASSRSSRPPVQ